ncbi:MAG: hypothetical protein JWM56_74 [Candidatus Peribacteria bacterium]|nr:hypothetical protein [Candidatus Peribacteria bacterium]
MNRSVTLSVFTLATLSMVGCRSGQTVLPDASVQSSASSIEVVSSSSSSSSSMTVVENVSYEGVIEPAGMSIYQEGTHRLNLSTGDFVLLESKTVNLDDYVGKHVTLTGDQRSTVEAGGTIVSVRSITIVDTRSSISSEQASSLSSSASSNAQTSSVPVAVPSSAASASSVSSVAVSSAAAMDAMQTRVAAMQKFKMDAASWNQQYCSSHAGFCIPVPKNAWYKSFGATTTSLWHVELSSEDILAIGDGPVAVNLVSGTVESKGATDGQVQDSGGVVTGYRAWTENRHVEITAPSALRVIVENITKGVTVQTQSSVISSASSASSR